jgi:hypothetical protein
METGQVDAQRYLDYVRHREPPELRGGPRRGAHNDVERGSGVPVQPVDQLPHGQARRPEHLRQRGQAVVGDHHRPDAAASRTIFTNRSSRRKVLERGTRRDRLANKESLGGQGTPGRPVPDSLRYQPVTYLDRRHVRRAW